MEETTDSREAETDDPPRPDPLAEGPLLLEHRENWAGRFGREAPIEVEIGFGWGHFVLEYAAARPEVDLVALEIRAKLAAHVARRAERLGLPNVAVIRGDARKRLPTLFAPGTVQAFHVQFPDPWWKKRHHKRRLVDDELTVLLHRLLVPGGRVYLRTDVLNYGRAMVAAFEDGSGRFENVEAPGAFVADDGLGVPSNRERRYLATGTPVYRLVYVKTR